MKVKKIESQVTPEEKEQLVKGEISIHKGYTAIIRKERKIQNESLKEKNPKNVEGLYDVIVIDPPWPIEKIERECRPKQPKEIDYPVMTLNEISEISIPTAEDCHIFLWTTHKFLPESFNLFNIWNFKYVCTFVWHKNGGFQPFGLPQYNCEFILYGRKGSPKFADLKAFNVCFNATRGKHSEKPLEFYETIKKSNERGKDWICLVEGKLMDLIHGEMKLIDWQDDKKWSDRFIPFIKPILGLYLIGEATQEDDKNKNTDLIVFKMDAVRIACRIRRYSYYKNITMNLQ